ncbi:DUF1129 domain-containing protein [Aerococcus kribbianus]|uniref:DUF1129 family protein n=1 Tax=Aerococcus kribbianus TaxID=2999064 RepID=A0A9X3FN68_9LACT|nr:MULTISPECIES: DUF1129 family protein [unclassified Aerococcus]MCZ0717627.1 DUF1129 family protein [Aerococcus sp. YH-aer221]MCZ0725915.1 DUF1129 family protein [Aerococcus sp. YH-aer222]
MTKKDDQQIDLTASRANWERENKEMYPQLTNKNADFMRKFKNEMADREFKGEFLEHENAMLRELLDKQKEGVTAKHLYGTPHSYAEFLENYEDNKPAEPASFGQYVIEGGLLIGGIFALINGVTMMLGGSESASSSAGIITLLMNFVVSGFAMAFITKNQPDLNKPKGERGMWRYIFVAIAVMLVWAAFIFLTQLIPASINRVLPPFVYILIGVLALLGRWWYKKTYNIAGTLF